MDRENQDREDFCVRELDNTLHLDLVVLPVLVELEHVRLAQADLPQGEIPGGIFLPLQLLDDFFGDEGSAASHQVLNTHPRGRRSSVRGTRIDCFKRQCGPPMRPKTVLHFVKKRQDKIDANRFDLIHEVVVDLSGQQPLFETATELRGVS